MALAKIKHLELVAPKDDQQQVLALLQRLGVVQIEDLAQEEAYPSGISPQTIGQEASKWEEILGRLKYLLDFLEGFRAKPTSLMAQLASSKKPITTREFHLDDATYQDILSLYQESRTIETKLPELERKDSELLERKARLEPWQNLTLPLEELGESAYVHTLAASISAKGWDSLQESLAELENPYVLAKLEGEERVIPFLLVVKKEDSQQAGQILIDNGATIPTFGQGAGTAKVRIAKLESELQSLHQKQEQLLARCQELAEEKLETVELLFDYATTRLERAQAQGQLLATDSTFALRGWILERHVEKLQAELAKLEFPVFFTVREAAEDEEAPVAMENSRLAWPFESVLEMYSPPKNGELDPTPWVGPFFSLFFGIMLTDAGYGIILALAAVWLLKKVKIEESGQKLLMILFWGGVASGVAGALAGGWFGDLFGLPPLWFNPIDDPLKMMALSFGLGLVHIFTGMGLEFYDNVRHGDIWAGIFDQGLWFVLILGLVFLLLPGFGVVGGWMAKIGAIGLILTQGRSQKNIFLKLGSGLASLYNITGILGDVLSYSRLLALGLATGVIANVINMVAKMALEFPYGIGYVVMVIVLLGGHAFNLFINTMGSYVHTSRLQYVEFFGKFFEGGGKIFSPFKIQQKYTYFKEDVKEEA